MDYFCNDLGLTLLGVSHEVMDSLVEKVPSTWRLCDSAHTLLAVLFFFSTPWHVWKTRGVLPRS